ncbi:MAG: D-2-hydroxyacid dehydrogenase [Vicinamibacterales bacterium]
MPPEQIAHRALILTKLPDEYRRLVEDARLTNLALVASPDVADGLSRAGDSDIVLGDPARVVQALPHLPHLKWVQLTWAGVEPMLDPALRRDYLLTNIRGVFGPLMSEYVFGYLLAHERKIIARHEAQRAGKWDSTLPGTLQGKTLGLVGVGSIGARVAATAKHFGMTVNGYTRSSEGCPDVDRYFHGANKKAFATGVDYLLAVLPNTQHTRGLVDATMLGALPAHAVVVNAGRGDALDERALVDALTARRLAAAVLDVFPEEPLPEGHVFWQTPGVHITCHTAAPSFPSDIVGVFADNYRRFARGEALRYQVDFERGY